MDVACRMAMSTSVSPPRQNGKKKRPKIRSIFGVWPALHTGRRFMVGRFAKPCQRTRGPWSADRESQIGAARSKFKAQAEIMRPLLIAMGISNFQRWHRDVM